MRQSRPAIIFGVQPIQQGTNGNPTKDVQSVTTQPSNANTIVGSSSLAQKGNFLSALNVKTERMSPWTVESGASNHMTSDLSVFHNYKPCLGNFSVRIADGSFSKVAGTGSVIISKNLTLDSTFSSKFGL